MTALMTQPAPRPRATTIGDYLRLNLTAQIEAVTVFIADAAAHNETVRLAALRKHEDGLWDALGYAAQLP